MLWCCVLVALCGYPTSQDLLLPSPFKTDATPHFRSIKDYEAWREQLTLPFYLYSEVDGVHADLERYAECAKADESDQYRSDIVFLQALEHHRWRTSDPNAAKIFVIPAALGLALANSDSIKDPGQCGYTLGKVREVLAAVCTTRMWAERWRDHLLLATSPYVVMWGVNEYKLKTLGIDWKDKRPNARLPIFASNERMTTASRLGPVMQNRTMPAPYMDRHHKKMLNVSFASFVSMPRQLGLFFGGSSGIKAMSSEEKARYASTCWAHESWSRPGGFSARYKVRHSVVNALALKVPQSLFMVSTPIHGKVDRPCCEHPFDWWVHNAPVACFGSFDGMRALAKADFVVVPKGDTRGSSRYVDIFETGALPVFVSDGIYKWSLPFPCLIPWQSFSHFVPEKDFIPLTANDTDSPLKGVTAVQELLTAYDTDRLIHARKLLWAFRRDILWQHERSRVAENVLLTASWVERSECPWGETLEHHPPPPPSATL